MQQPHNTRQQMQPESSGDDGQGAVLRPEPRPFEQWLVTQEPVSIKERVIAEVSWNAGAAWQQTVQLRRSEPPCLMLELGVEGDLFHRHHENANCRYNGCVPFDKSIHAHLL